MGNFEREGTFQDRAKFIEGFKASVGKVMGSGSPGVTETWTQEGDSDVGRVSGFGAKVELKVGADTWTCTAEFPAWLPIPPSTLEAKLDEKLKDLSGL